jgi:2-amino-4-hydroxy-6-hydroxymethyldihydropteridine diphosphokinase
MAGSLAHIGLGSNLGDRGLTLMQALKALDDVDGVVVRQVSQFVQTEPVGGAPDQPPYLNAAVEVSVSLSPQELLAALQEIERSLGRDRPSETRWGPRTCDLDILLIGETVLDGEGLTIPHPRMHERVFVLEPLASIAPEAVHPVLGKTVTELLAEARCAGPAEDAGQGEAAETAETHLAAETPAAATLISVIGPPASGKTTLAEHLAAELPGELIREDYEGNPFLADSYTGPVEARLPAQLFYLLSRVSQLSRASWPAEGVYVSDYGFCQDRLYACERLAAEDMPAYEAVYERLAGLVHPPDLLILLDASPATLLERIARRGRAFEQVMTGQFISAMRQAYNSVQVFADCPVLTVNCEEEDVREEAARGRLIERIRHELWT